MKRVEKMAKQYAVGKLFDWPIEARVITAYDRAFRDVCALAANLVTQQIADTTELDGIEALIAVRAAIEALPDQPVDEKEGE